MKKFLGVTKVLMFSLVMIFPGLNSLAQEFDLNYIPNDRKELDSIATQMLSTGKEIVYRTDHPNQKLWIFQPDNLKKDELLTCVFFIHGGGWGGSPILFAPQSIYLKDKGLVVVNIHFRKPSSEEKISPIDCLKDCLSAFRWIKENAYSYHIDPEKIIVSGGSAGAHLALAMLTFDAYNHSDDNMSIPIDPKGLIFFNPAIDLVEGWEGGAQKCVDHGIDPFAFSPAHHIKKGIPSTLVLSGSEDNVIPPKLIRQFMERMNEKGNHCKFVEYEGVGHGFFNYGRLENQYFFPTMQEMVGFIKGLDYQ